MDNGQMRVTPVMSVVWLLMGALFGCVCVCLQTLFHHLYLNVNPYLHPSEMLRSSGSSPTAVSLAAESPCRYSSLSFDFPILAQFPLDSHKFQNHLERKPPLRGQEMKG